MLREQTAPRVYSCYTSPADHKFLCRAGSSHFQPSLNPGTLSRWWGKGRFVCCRVETPRERSGGGYQGHPRAAGDLQCQGNKDPARGSLTGLAGDAEVSDRYCCTPGLRARAEQSLLFAFSYLCRSIRKPLSSITRSVGRAQFASV